MHLAVFGGTFDPPHNGHLALCLYAREILEIDKLFINEKRTSFTDKLSSVTLKLPAENTEVTGFYYHILRKIAWEGINIVEVISTTNEFTIVVNDKDVDKAFSVLKSMS